MSNAASSEPHEIAMYTNSGVCPHDPASLSSRVKGLFVQPCRCVSMQATLPATGDPDFGAQENVYCGDAQTASEKLACFTDS